MHRVILRSAQVQMLKDILTARGGNDKEAAQGEDVDACAQACEGEAEEGADDCDANAHDDARGSSVDQATTLAYVVRAPEEQPAIVEKWPPNPHISRSSLKRWTTPWNSATGKPKAEIEHVVFSVLCGHGSKCTSIRHTHPRDFVWEDAAMRAPTLMLGDVAPSQDPALLCAVSTSRHCLLRARVNNSWVSLEVFGQGCGSKKQACFKGELESSLNNP